MTVPHDRVLYEGKSSRTLWEADHLEETPLVAWPRDSRFRSEEVFKV